MRGGSAAAVTPPPDPKFSSVVRCHSLHVSLPPLLFVLLSFHQSLNLIRDPPPLPLGMY